MGTNNVDSNSQSSNPKEDNWTTWPSLLVLFSSIIIVTLLVIFVFVEGLFDKVSDIVKGLWLAFTTFITFLGIKKGKEISWPGLFKLLPTQMIVVFYSIVNLLLIVYFVLAGVCEHKIYISSTLDGNAQSSVEILWENKHKGFTLSDGNLPDPVSATSGTYTVTAIYGKYKINKDVKVDWLWPFEQSFEVQLVSDPAVNGKVFIQSRIRSEIVEGVDISVERTGESFKTPDTLILNPGIETLKAEITRNGRVYRGTRQVEINVGPNSDVTIELIEIDCLPKTLIINAKYENNVIEASADIIINGITYRRRLPATISGLNDTTFNVEVLYTRNNYTFRGIASPPLELDCGETRPVTISLYSD